MTKKRRLWYLLFINVIVLTWLWAGVADSQSNYTIKRSVLDGGGGVRKTAQYILSQSIAQPSVIGISSNDQYTISAGFYGAPVALIPAPQYTLTVEKAGTGTGTVTGDGIDCGAVCTQKFEQETVVILEAIPDPGSTFDGWSGAGCSGTGYCSITIIADTTVTATFTFDPLLTPTPTVPPGPTPTPPPVNPIPEPATFFLIGIGLLSLFVFIRRRRKAK